MHLFLKIWIKIKHALFKFNILMKNLIYLIINHKIFLHSIFLNFFNSRKILLKCITKGIFFKYKVFFRIEGFGFYFGMKVLSVRWLARQKIQKLKGKEIRSADTKTYRSILKSERCTGSKAVHSRFLFHPLSKRVN